MKKSFITSGAELELFTAIQREILLFVSSVEPEPRILLTLHSEQVDHPAIK